MTSIAMLQYLVILFPFVSYSRDNTNTNAADFCWQFTSQASCEPGGVGVNIPIDILPTSVSEQPRCRWIDIHYLNGCNYIDATNPVPTDETDVEDSLGCASLDRPDVPTAQCVADDCYLYETNETLCRESALCDWVVNDMTLFDGGRCMNS